ncbi:MAG: hypothetical protein RMJ38_07675, partial [candidate division WOR-3 bacterium]|nr:hypothetical protein [candidate division WOR-3 bacterium]MDW8151299.1 hypothetical protein [candidate division WOR-3 bacterium]
HCGNSHRDEYFAISIFIYNIFLIIKKFKLRNIIKKIRILRINENEFSNYNSNNYFNIYIDIGRNYLFPIAFDHHQDSKLYSSLLLVINAFYNIDNIYNDFKKYFDLIAIDYIDRFGIDKFVDFVKEKINIENLDNKLIVNYMLLLNSSFNNLHLKLFSKHKIINSKHYLFKYLYNIGKLIDLKLKFLIKNNNFDIDIVNLNEMKIIINLDNRIT